MAKIPVTVGEEGLEIFIESQDETAHYRGTRGGDEDPEVKEKVNFSQAVKTVTSMAKDLKVMVEKSNSSKTVVEFGFELAVDTDGVAKLFIKGSGKATFKVTMEWASSSKTEESATITKQEKPNSTAAEA